MTLDDPTAGALVDLLRGAGAGERRHAGGRTLLEHLTETAEIIARWGQPAALRHAALIHSVYGTDAYRERLLSDDRRRELAAVAGPEAERLAHLFCVTPRGPLLAGTYRWARGLPTRRDGDPSADAVRAGDEAAPTPAELEALVVLHMANLAEQARAADGSPGRWLARLGALAEPLLHADARVLPPAVAALATLDDADEAQAARAYRAAVGRGDDDGQRAARLALASAACPVVAEPYVWQAHVAWARDDRDAAGAWGRHAHRRLAALGTTWDKRLSFAEWERLAVAFVDPPPPERAATGAPTHPRALLLALAQRAPSSPDGRRPTPGRPASPVAPDVATGRRRFARYVERLGEDEPGVYPGLAARPWHDPAAFPLAVALEAHFAEIREEILALSPSLFAPESEPIARAGDWDVAFLYERGRRRDDICAACPATTRAMEGHGAMLTVDGLSYASRMRAATHIRPHRGPTNLRLRCHLGIVVPDGDCALRVADETRRWREGSCLVFDDHFEHEAWNRTGADRIVLIVDLWHPGLSATEVGLLEGLHGAIQRRADGLARYRSANAAAARIAGAG